jgi:thioredoxin reductase/bacterioferritin-associated ferredoxin
MSAASMMALMTEASRQHQLIIVGAGPAGMAAALEAAECGIDVLIVDEQRRIGGQIFRRTPKEFRGEGRLAEGYSWAPDLIARVEQHDRISFMGGATVFGVFLAEKESGPRIEVVLSSGDGAHRRQCERLLIATGAFDLPVAFPGWTLPGVFTAGAVQSFIKAQKLLPGARFVVAGSHPLQIIVADQLRAAGAHVAEVSIARGWFSPRELVSSLGAIPGHLRLMLSLAGAVGRLLAARIPIRWGSVVIEAQPGESTSQLAGVTIARCDRHWRPTGEHRHIAVDSLVLGYGFSASTELARQIGCQLLYNSAAGGWLVAHDAELETSVSGVYVAGEPTGVAGAEQSRAEGMLAGHSIARSLGVEPSAARVRHAGKTLRTARRFSRVVHSLFAPQRRGLSELAKRDTVICRCERVSRGRIDQTIEDNPYMRSVSAVKLETRCGMGPCQGRYCESSLAQILADQRGRTVSEVGVFAAHIPVKPVPLSAYEALAVTSDAPVTPMGGLAAEQ